MRQRIYLFSGLVLLLVVPLALLVSRKIAGSLTRLEKESIKIRRSDFSASEPFDSSIKEVHSLIEAFFLMKSKIRQLLDQQRKLFDDFTKLIAGAIDAKSPYTGGHCARVPVIAQMLSDAACESNAPPFAAFNMQTADQRWEFEVAAWLHDCGKVTTPEYVVDKATKLETLYNRIHEIRMRFEVLLRDAEIDCCRRRLAGDMDESRLEEELAQTRKAIVDDFAFVAACNVGGEFMADEKIDRLRQIATRTWVRHLDDRIGISQEEAALKNQEPSPSLPVIEAVLADKPEHVIPRTQADPFDGNPHGFSMTVPKDQYNLGEIYNLSIRKGTLSPEDRFKINEHIIQTIIMLERLDFPEYLTNVPEFAGAHHETMIGTGYPRGLKKEDMSIPARIMAIADIFEALTAADRPYKAPKSLSEALKIMSLMRDDQHIDAELFDLFLKSGIYRTYADRYLNRSQIDEVDIRHYVSIRND
jgi:HD-GYP domain-containing protein (c-di-GMP phosphodiesterase class II)